MPVSAKREADLAQAKDRLLSRPRPTAGVLDLPRFLQRQESVPLAYIQTNPNQPRKAFDEAQLEELAGTIAKNGLLQPINLRQVGEDAYVIVAGERRFRAFQLLASQPRSADYNPGDFKRIPALIAEIRGEDADLVVQVRSLLENIARVDLSAAEEVQSFKELHDRWKLRYREIADLTGLRIETVIRKSGIARYPVLVEALGGERITQEKAIEVSKVANEDLVAPLIAEVQDLTLAQTRELVRDVNNLGAVEQAGPAELVADRGRIVRGEKPGPALPPAPRGRPRIERNRPLRYSEKIPLNGSDEVTIAKVRLGEIAIFKAAGVTKMRREWLSVEEFASALQATCEETGVWPSPPS